MKVYAILNNSDIVKVFSSFNKALSYLKTTYPTGFDEHFDSDYISWNTQTKDEKGYEIILDLQCYQVE
jgi:hypothetical protein